MDEFARRTWDYRGTIAEGGSGPSYIDIDFPGYVGFTATGYSSIPTGWKHVGTPRGPNIHRFQTTTNGWFGNFELHIQSVFSNERLVNAWIVGGETDNFILPPDINDRVFDGLNDWPKVFGPLPATSPVPEPSSVTILVFGLVGLASAQVLRKGRRRYGALSC